MYNRYKISLSFTSPWQIKIAVICKEMYIYSIHLNLLILWGRLTHMCVANLTIIGSDNGLSPGLRQAIIWTNDGILLNVPLGTDFSENSIEIHIVSFTKMYLKMFAKWCLFRLGLNVVIPMRRKNAIEICNDTLVHSKSINDQTDICVCLRLDHEYPMKSILEQMPSNEHIQAIWLI